MGEGTTLKTPEEDGGYNRTAQIKKKVGEVALGFAVTIQAVTGTLNLEPSAAKSTDSAAQTHQAKTEQRQPESATARRRRLETMSAPAHGEQGGGKEQKGQGEEGGEGPENPEIPEESRSAERLRTREDDLEIRPPELGPE